MASEQTETEVSVLVSNQGELKLTASSARPMEILDGNLIVFGAKGYPIATFARGVWVSAIQRGNHVPAV